MADWSTAQLIGFAILVVLTTCVALLVILETMFWFQEREWKRRD
jgi:hypothetical protein